VVAGRTVVIADDHPLIRKKAESILSEHFEVVATVASGFAAIDAARRQDPDVVVLDIEMPGLDGFQTAARLRAAGSRAQIVFLSNHTGDDFVLAGITRGAAAFVAKPRMQIDLVEAVGHVRAGRTFVPSARVLRQWQRPAGRRHHLQLYSTDAFLVDSVLDLFDSALEAGDSIVAIASPTHRMILEARAPKRGVALDRLVASGRCVLVDAPSTLESILVNGNPDAALFSALLAPIINRALAASTGSPPHVTMFGEIAPILCARGEFEQMLRLERIADEFVASRPMSLLCAYPASPQTNDHLGDLCSAHATIVAPEQ
jgi:DNA-binding NarL/FixJ family response regulator